MKYQFKNIGPIKNAELELGGLTIIAGKNNTGKTYIAHSLYEFQRYLLLKAKERSLGFWEGSKDVNLLFDKSGVVNGSIDIATATKMVKRFIEDTHRRRVSNSLFSQRDMSFLEGVSGVFSDADLVIPEQIDKKQNADILGGVFLSLKREGNSFVFSLPSGKIGESADEERVDMFKLHIKEELTKVLTGFALGSSTLPFILTTERFGISIFYKELDFAKNRLVEGLQKIADSRHEGENDSQVLSRLLLLSDSSARYSQPVKDNIDYTRGLGDAIKRSSELSQAKIFKGIEKMMEGSYKHDGNGVIFASSGSTKRGKAISPNVNKGIKLRLHRASSSVCGLSDMYFYLKHVAKKNQLMIIDEPESNLDTANQIRLARLLAQCVNAGLRVLITTHSDYIIKEFNNLIMLSYDFPEKGKFLKGRGKEYSGKEFLQKESVRAYVCEKDGLSPCAIDHRGMSVALFDDTIKNINRVSDELDIYLPD